MKRLLLIVAIGAFAASLYADTVVPWSVGVITAVIESKTLAQVDATIPLAAGQLVYCSNCQRSSICVSSGTGRGAFTVGIATGPFITGPQDCQ